MTAEPETGAAGERSLGERAWRRLRGLDLPPERYALCRRLFCSGLAFVYLCAFGSLWVQIDGLAGSGGILPAQAWLDRVHEALPPAYAGLGSKRSSTPGVTLRIVSAQLVTAWLVTARLVTAPPPKGWRRLA